MPLRSPHDAKWAAEIPPTYSPSPCLPISLPTRPRPLRYSPWAPFTHYLPSRSIPHPDSFLYSQLRNRKILNNMNMGRQSWAKRLECPVDADGAYENDRWTNRDLIPIPPDRRTYKIWSFAVSRVTLQSPLLANWS